MYRVAARVLIFAACLCACGHAETEHDEPDAGHEAAPRSQDGAGPVTAADARPELPVGAPVTVGASGGTVSLPDGAAVEIPAGALDKTTVIAVRVLATVPELPDILSARGKAYAFEPHGTRFLKPVTLRLPFAGAADALFAARLDDASDTSWERVSGGKAAGHLLALSVTHFSIYRVVGIGVVTAPDAAVPEVR